MFISKLELQKHKTADSLWVSIKKNVYDLTMFLETHPNAYETLMKIAGKDATEIFAFNHSFEAMEGLKKYYIGALE